MYFIFYWFLETGEGEERDRERGCKHAICSYVPWPRIAPTTKVYGTMFWSTEVPDQGITIRIKEGCFKCTGTGIFVTSHGVATLPGWLVIEATQWLTVKKSVLFRKGLTLTFACISLRGSISFSFLIHKEDVSVINLLPFSSKSPLLCSASWFWRWPL